MSPSLLNKFTHLRRGLVLATAVLVGVGMASCSQAPAGGQPAEGGGGSAARDVNVALIAYAPFCNTAGDTPSGMEPEILGTIAEEIGITPKYAVSDFAGQLASVQSGRNDLAICLFYWTEERTETGVYTDPVMYAPIQVLQKADSDIDDVAEMEGKTIGSITGYSWNPALENIPGATVKLYPEYPALLEDLAAGRVDLAPADALVNSTAIEERPEWNLHTVDLAVPTDEQVEANPELIRLRPSQIAWFVNQDSPELADEISVALRDMYTDGSLAEILESYGADPEAWLIPPGDYIAEQRRGVDRPDDWEAPSIE